MHKRKNVKRILAYIYMPVFLSLIGFLLVFICLSPYISAVYSVMSILSGETTETTVDVSGVPDFKLENAQNQEEEIPYSSDMYPALGELYAQITCERLGIKEDIYFGDSRTELRNGVGQYAGTPIFGFGAPILLGGHHATSFAPLEYVEIGDVFTVVTSYGKYTYEVYDTRIADQNDRSAFGFDSNEEIITMYTCYPFTPLTSYTQRLYVYARKTSGPKLVY